MPRSRPLSDRRGRRSGEKILTPVSRTTSVPGSESPSDSSLSRQTGEPTGWLDLARVVAIGAVLMVHESGAALGSRGPAEPAGPAWWAALVLDAASRWCVPVFLMVSGALLLDPRRTESPGTFYRRRLTRIGLPLVVWTAVYLLFGHYYLGRPLTVRDASRAVATGAPFLHLYFLYVLAVLYLLTPFLRPALRGMSHRRQAGFVAVLLGLGLTDRALMTFLEIGEPNAATRFLPYLAYFVAGWFLRDIAPQPRLTRLSAVALPLSVVVTIVAAGLGAAAGRGWGRYGEYALSYHAPGVAVMSVAVFWLLRIVGTRPGAHWRPGPVTAQLSALTFGVFLVHALLFYPLVRDWEMPDELVPYLTTAAWHWLVTAAGSVAITLVLRRLPLLHRLV